LKEELLLTWHQHQQYETSGLESKIRSTTNHERKLIVEILLRWHQKYEIYGLETKTSDMRTVFSLCGIGITSSSTKIETRKLAGMA